MTNTDQQTNEMLDALKQAEYLLDTIANKLGLYTSKESGTETTKVRGVIARAIAKAEGRA